ncbi:RHS repeat-associated core domain-containing protein [Paenibacillus chitinolyticus]|uniref:RHS repeat-associated core domain-containing protein n=1 Tax=Paenibacillus chitinolyticus TaxID=79263 RepID=UPI0035590B96
MKKKINYLVLFCLVVQMLAPLYVIHANEQSASNPQQISQLLTVESLSKTYGVPETDLLSELNKGYSLSEIQSALQTRQDPSQPLGEILNQMNPTIEEQLKKEDYSAERFAEKHPQPGPTAPTVSEQTYGTYVEPTGDSIIPDPSLLYPPGVTDATYGRASLLSSNKYPTSYDELAVKRLDIKADRAPSASSISEDVSTVNGSLQIQTTDMTLPGRNGLSFELKRKYDSSDALYYEKDILNGSIYTTRYYPELTSQLYFKYSNQPVTENGSASDFYFGPAYQSFVQYMGEYTYWYFPANYPVIEEFNNEVYDSFKKAWPYMDPKNPNTPPFIAKENIRLFGLDFYAKAYTTGNVRQDPMMVPEFRGTAYANKTKPIKNENRYPIGKGWSWDLPYIESKDNGKTYIRLFGGATYELDDRTLKGYPWKDLTMYYDSSIKVNNLPSSYRLESLDGKKQYFAYNGKLIQITDAYQNTIQFEYQDVTPYGQVLTKIKDAIGNEISIAYTEKDVTLTSGDRTVKYDKIKDPQGNKELLSQVTDPAGRKTQYVYSIEAAPFDLVRASSMKDNYVALLKQVYHPTKAKTDYTYETFTRSLGVYAKETVHRVKTREDVVTFADGTESRSNRVDYTYSGDGGAVQERNTSFATTINNGRTQTTHNYDKVYVDDKTPEIFYNTQIKQDDGTQQTIQTMEYNRTNRWPSPIKTTTKTVQGSANSTEQVVQRTYDEYGNVLTETDPANAVTTYQYDASTHLVSSVTKPLQSGLNTYTELERYPTTNGIKVVRIKENNAAGALKAQTSYTYDAYGNPVQISVKDDTKDTIVNQIFGAQYQGGFLTEQSVEVTDATKQNSVITQRLEYNPSTGSMTKFTDGKGFDTRYEYDKLGRTTKVTQPDTSFSTYTYNDEANEITTVDPTGVTAFAKWNPLGWKIKTGIVGKPAQEFGYDSYGRQVWSQDGAGNRTSYEYDKRDRLVATTYPGAEQAKSTIEYDDVNRIVTSKDGEGNKVKESFDLLGRLAQKEVYSSAGTLTESIRYSYDSAGNLATVNDGTGNNPGDVQTTQYGYDVMNRLIAVTDPETNTTRYTYSLANKLTQIEYPDHNKTQKAYDQMGRLIQETDPLGQTETSFYDAGNNLIKAIDRKGNAQTFTYNSLNLQTTSVTGDESLTFQYDAAGRRLSMQDRTGTTNYLYDPSTGWLKQVQYPDKRTLQYAYDGQGNRTQMTDPFGVVTNYQYDARNRLKAVGQDPMNWDTEYQYKNNNLPAVIQGKNGLVSAYNYEVSNLTSMTQNLSGTGINSFGYGYDLHGNQKTKTENGKSNAYTYDLLNRIATASEFNENYSYDSRGNRLTLQSDKPVSSADMNYSYDERNRLSEAKVGEGTGVRYTYNGDGLLTERTENGETSRYYYDGDQIIAEATVTNGTVAHKASYIRGIDLATPAVYEDKEDEGNAQESSSNTDIWGRTVIVQTEGKQSGVTHFSQLVAKVDVKGDKAYYVHNGHGDVIELRDAGGALLNQYTYDLWGNPTMVQEKVSNPFGYSGEYWDNTAKLQYLRARWYDPGMGRFLNEDTYQGQLNSPLSLNLYTYVLNNPLRYIDPSGHMDMQAGSESVSAGGRINSGSAFQGGGGGGRIGRLASEKDLRSQGKPYENHTTVKKTDTTRSLPTTGKPNSSVDFYDNGKLTQRRYYDEKGRAKQDIDYEHSNGDNSHDFPHSHTWDWSSGSPKRSK